MLHLTLFSFFFNASECSIVRATVKDFVENEKSNDFFRKLAKY